MVLSNQIPDPRLFILSPLTEELIAETKEIEARLLCRWCNNLIGVGDYCLVPKNPERPDPCGFSWSVLCRRCGDKLVTIATTKNDSN